DHFVTRRGNPLVALALQLEIEEYPFADRILAGEELLRHRLADHELAGARVLRVEADAVVLAERSAAEQPDAGCGEVLRIDAALVRGQERAGNERPSLDVEEQDVAWTGQRCARGEADGIDTRQHP